MAGSAPYSTAENRGDSPRDSLGAGLSGAVLTPGASHELPSKSPDGKERQWTDPEVWAHNFKGAKDKKKKLSPKSLWSFQHPCKTSATVTHDVPSACLAPRECFKLSTKDLDSVFTHLCFQPKFPQEASKLHDARRAQPGTGHGLSCDTSAHATVPSSAR